MEGYINPTFCTKPSDTPYHLREMYKSEIKQSLDAGHIAPCGTEPSEWSSKAFPVLKGDGTSVRIVADCKSLTRNIQRPVWPTESSNQLLRHIDAGSRFFATMDLTSGYHQIPIDKESQDLLVIYPPMGRFKYLVLAQGVYSASDIFNLLTDGSMSSLQIWNPSFLLNLSMLRKASGSKGKVTWNEELEEEYKNVMNIMQTRIRLSPYDQTKRLWPRMKKSMQTKYEECKQCQEHIAS